MGHWVIGLVGHLQDFCMKTIEVNANFKLFLYIYVRYRISPIGPGASGTILLTGRFGTPVDNSFLRRAAKSFNQIPLDIREARTIDDFKGKLKLWTKTNIPIG